MCKLPCFEGNHCKNMQTHSKNTGFGGFCGEKMQITVQNAAWTVFLGVVYVNYSLLIWSSWSAPPLAPVTDQNKPAVWAATPREAGWIHPKLSGSTIYKLSGSIYTIHPYDHQPRHWFSDRELWSDCGTFRLRQLAMWGSEFEAVMRTISLSYLVACVYCIHTHIYIYIHISK